MSTIADNLARVREQIALAAGRSGRTAETVTLVAVTKYVDVALARQLVEAGCRDLGESRPQELWRKADELTAGDVRWHFIGHLQRNKLKRTLPLVSLLHSGDSADLIAAVAEQASATGQPCPLLVEVNVSGDATKHGFDLSDLEAITSVLESHPQLDFRGLMCMAGREGDLDAARREFAALRELRDRLSRATGRTLPELSMGMSGDFEVAIEEGATIVRVGSALFEGLA
jgi:hypothetical protein